MKKDTPAQTRKSMRDSHKQYVEGHNKCTRLYNARLRLIQSECQHKNIKCLQVGWNVVKECSDCGKML